MKYTLSELSGLDRAPFVAALDGVFEHSPWVAQDAWRQRPFSDEEDLLRAFEQVLRDAPLESQLQLVRAHPELAGREALQGELTDASNREQHSAGLDRCTSQELADLRQLNAAYRTRFGFPFVVAVRDLSRRDIIARLRSRLDDTPQVALATSLDEIVRIAAARLRERLE